MPETESREPDHELVLPIQPLLSSARCWSWFSPVLTMCWFLVIDCLTFLGMEYAKQALPIILNCGNWERNLKTHTIPLSTQYQKGKPTSKEHRSWVLGGTISLFAQSNVHGCEKLPFCEKFWCYLMRHLDLGFLNLEKWFQPEQSMQ